MSLIKIAVINAQQMGLQRKIFADPNQGPKVAGLYDRFTSAVAQAKQSGDLSKMRSIGQQLKASGVQRAMPTATETVSKTPGLISKLKPLPLLKKVI